MKKLETKTVYVRQPGDDVVVFDGKNYCVKTSWKPIARTKAFTAYAVIEGEEMFDGMFPAAQVEALESGGRKWEVIGVMGPELEDETGAGCGILLWSAENGFVENGVQVATANRFDRGT